MQLASGMLLVATPELQDPNFADTVVLLLDVTEEGALGVVLNRPSQIMVADVLEPWRDVVAEPEVLFRGGPVGTDGALAVGALRDPQDPPVGWRPVAGLLGMVDLDTPTELVDGTLSAMRVFAGYAGWGAGQLDVELAEGSWLLAPVQTDLVFQTSIDTMWEAAIRRLGAEPSMLQGSSGVH